MSFNRNISINTSNQVQPLKYQPQNLNQIFNNGNLVSTFVNIAQQEASEIWNSYRDLTKNQLRKFYDEFKRYDMNIVNDETFNYYKPLIGLIKAKAEYSKKKIGSLNDFIKNAVDFIIKQNDYKVFKNFMKYFEAIYCFLHSNLRN